MKQGRFFLKTAVWPTPPTIGKKRVIMSHAKNEFSSFVRQNIPNVQQNKKEELKNYENKHPALQNMKFSFKDFICKCRVRKCHPQITTNKNDELRPNPLNTGRKVNALKSFIVRLRHLLNVLCTFNLRPVSMGRVFLLMSTTWVLK